MDFIDTKQSDNSQINLVNCVADKALMEVRFIGARSARLTKYEFRVARMLINARGKPVAKRLMFKDLYPDRIDEPASGFKAMETVVGRLRTKLSAIGLVVDTYYGDGWALRPAAAATPAGCRVVMVKSGGSNAV